MKKLAYLFSTIGLAVLSLQAQAQTHRYMDRVFTQTEKTTDIIYASAIPDNSTTAQDLKLDFFEPANDTETARPLVIALFGGSFIAGSKEADDIQAWCDSLAYTGYATAAINYRIGFNFMTPGAIVRAGYRAVQDGKAAIRFFKEHADTYKIDTNQIFLIGNSAGAITALQMGLAYDTYKPTEASGIPGSTRDTEDLGDLNSSGNNYVYNTNVQGVVNLWGAFMSLEAIDTTKKTPLLSFHGDADYTVPIDSGYAMGLEAMPVLYGSRLIHHYLMNVNGQYTEMYVQPGLGHNYYYNNSIFPNNAHWGEILGITKNFLCRFNTKCDEAALAVTKPQLTMNAFQVFPNPAQNEVNIRINDNFNEVIGTQAQINIFNINGQLMAQKEQTLENVFTISTADLSNGVYFVHILAQNGAMSMEKLAIQK